MRRKVSFLVTVVLFCVSALSVIDIPASISDKKISLMGIKYSDGGDRTSWISTSANYVQGVGNTSVSKFIDFDINDVLDQFFYQDMVVLHTHGNQSGILTYKDNTERILTSTIVDGVFSSSALSKLRICFVGACSCGSGGSGANNFINTIYEQGALCVIGYQDTVRTDCNREMLNRFCYYIGSGYSVKNSLTKAEQDVFNKYGEYGNVNNRLVRGVSEIAMTDVSYRAIGGSEYSLEDYSLKKFNVNSENVLFADEENVCAKTGDMFSYDENNKVYSYTKLDLGTESEYSKSVNLDTFWDCFNIDGYKMEINQYASSKMVCMRAYINDLKTNDIIYYTVDENEELLSYGYPRIGKAKEAEYEYKDIDKNTVLDYLRERYGIYEAEDIIVDVNDVDNVVINVNYRDTNAEYESIETINIPINEFR